MACWLQRWLHRALRCGPAHPEWGDSTTSSSLCMTAAWLRYQRSGMRLCAGPPSARLWGLASSSRGSARAECCDVWRAGVAVPAAVPAAAQGRLLQCWTRCVLCIAMHVCFACVGWFARVGGVAAQGAHGLAGAHFWLPGAAGCAELGSRGVYVYCELCVLGLVVADAISDVSLPRVRVWPIPFVQYAH